MSYGETFKLWRDVTSDNWRTYTNHAFVRGMADGSLPKAAFVHYLTQDYVFLFHFSRAWALAITKARTVEEMRLCAATVDALINEEIALHIKVCADAGISEAQLSTAEERPENLAYTRYVLEAGYSGDFLDLMAALAPCVFGYGEIGRTLKETHEVTPYEDWIDTYSCDEYQSLCTEVGALIDQAIAERLGPKPTESPRWVSLCQHFDMATRLEIGFWDMGMRP